MRIRIDTEDVQLEVTLKNLLTALASEARNEEEIAASLICMLAEGRIHFLPQLACAA